MEINIIKLSEEYANGRTLQQLENKYGISLYHIKKM